jgi:cbb3-type cytochrome oxidase subunit 3
MYREFFIQSPVLGLPILSLLIFITVFAGIVVRTMRRRGSQFDEAASLPLNDGDVQ